MHGQEKDVVYRCVFVCACHVCEPPQKWCVTPGIPHWVQGRSRWLHRSPSAASVCVCVRERSCDAVCLLLSCMHGDGIRLLLPPLLCICLYVCEVRQWQVAGGDWELCVCDDSSLVISLSLSECVLKTHTSHPGRGGRSDTWSRRQLIASPSGMHMCVFLLCMCVHV